MGRIRKVILGSHHEGFIRLPEQKGPVTNQVFGKSKFSANNRGLRKI